MKRLPHRRLGSEVKGGREEGGREDEGEKRGEGRGKEKATVYRYGVMSSVITLEAATALK